MNLGIKGKVALVTGGSRGLGRQSALALAAEGVNVAICARGEETLNETAAKLKATGVKVGAFVADLGDESGASDLVTKTEDELGPIDILVNNASIFESIPLDELTSDAARMMWIINAEAPLMMIKKSAPHLRFEGVDQPGSVINIIDNSSGRKDWPEYSHYCASKAALLSVTRSLAQELAPAIRVNAVGPGAILFQDWEDESRRAAVLSSIPMDRLGKTSEIADTVLFLASGPSYITGQIIDVDGGWSLS